MSFWSTAWNVIKKVGSAALGFGTNALGSSLGSSIAGGITSAISNKQQMKYQKELMALQNDYNVKAASKSYNYSKNLQNLQNAFTSRLASTAHQIEVNDLRKAGLNPILSATGGSGAAVPAAGNASVSVQGVSGASAPDVDYGASALAYREQRNNDRRADADTWLARQQAGYYGEMERNEAEKYDSIVQDRKNSIEMTSAQSSYFKQLEESSKMDAETNRMNAITNRMVGSSQAWRNLHQALGFSESKSYSGNLGSGSFNIGAGGKKSPFHFGLSSPSLGGSYSHSRTY